MGCKNLKIRTLKGKKYAYCILYKKVVDFNCKCSKIEYKEHKTLSKSKTPMRKASKALCKQQKNRFSIIYQEMTKCCVCGLKWVEINEVFEGRNRSNSMKYGMCCPLCKKHHDQFHNDIEFNHYFKRLFQSKFEENHTREEFIKIFKRNYLDIKKEEE